MNPSRRGVLALFALLLLSNAAVLARIASNRSGPPATTLVLTERELALPYRRASDEDTGLALRLRTDDAAEIDAAALRRLGFDLSVPLSSPRAWRFYRQVRARSAWLVLEQDGPAWESWRERRKRELAARPPQDYDPQNDYELGQFEQEERMGSRLLVVEVGKDAAALRRRFPDRNRYAVVPGKVDLRYTPAVEDPPHQRPVQIEGSAQLAGPSLHVPLRWRPVLDRFAAAPPDVSGKTPVKPRYRATVAFGRSGEPWLVQVERLPQ